MKLFVSGLINIETNLKIRAFPITYYPIDYPFFGIKSAVSGVGFNVVKAARTLGDEVEFCSFTGKDVEAKRVYAALDECGVGRGTVFDVLDETPASVVLRDNSGRRQIYCDLKDIQERTVDPAAVDGAMKNADVCVLCNINFNRPLLDAAKRLGKTIATDVHVLSDLHDNYNLDFLKSADILFLSDEDLPMPPHDFLIALKNEYAVKIIVMGLGSRGAALYERDTDTVTFVPSVNIGGVVNTVGAGDALFTSFIHYYGKHGAIEALKRAQVFAALKIRHDGGAVGFSTEQEVEEVYRGYEFK